MARAGRLKQKTVTRRIVTYSGIRPECFDRDETDRLDRWFIPRFDGPGDDADQYTLADVVANPYLLSPYGGPGDYLAMREQWAAEKQWDGVAARDIPVGSHIYYPADPECDEDGRGKWRPPMFMVGWMYQIFLPITAYSIQRVCDISVGHIIREGAWVPPDGWLELHDDYGTLSCPAREFEDRRPWRAWCELWDAINGTRGSEDGSPGPYCIAANPWVHVIEFQDGPCGRPDFYQPKPIP